MKTTIKNQLESIKESLKNESVSYGELSYLQTHVKDIPLDDIELIQASGLSEKNYEVIVELTEAKECIERGYIIDVILEYSGDEYEDRESLIDLAKQTNEELIETINQIIDYYYDFDNQIEN